ncbi:hypothetical protein GS502_13540 [Rhodococcus hoagii]|nr:hypothetical protein [Prescottella equi]
MTTGPDSQLLPTGADEAWRPLGVDTDEQIAEYDALHGGVPKWMYAALWAWIRAELTEYRRYPDGSGRMAHLREDLTEQMCQTLQIPLPSLRVETGHDNGIQQLSKAMKVLQEQKKSLQITDYLLAHRPKTQDQELDALLERSKSAWRVGTRSGKPGLERRVPLGVQEGADLVMARAGHAGVRLAKAWEYLYGLNPNPSAAYREAILAVEDAVIPVVSPKNSSATLGTVLKQLEDQGDWSLPMVREHSKAPTREVVIDMMRMLWHGQHDRHAGQPSAPGNVNEAEATVAVSIATPIVHWFSAGLVNRTP